MHGSTKDHLFAMQEHVTHHVCASLGLPFPQGHCTKMMATEHEAHALWDLHAYIELEDEA
jgi:hypothetical protein